MICIAQAILVGVSFQLNKKKKELKVRLFNQKIDDTLKVKNENYLNNDELSSYNNINGYSKYKS